MKIAIIGSGAAALGVLDRLSALTNRPDITLIDRARRLEPVEPPVGSWTRESLRPIYRQIKAKYGYSFPPPKTNFGLAPRMQDVEAWGQVWDSGLYGGLTSIWGLSAIPFSAHDLQGWPFGRAELDPHYASVAQRIGIAGEHDALNQWLGDDFVNRPPIEPTPLAAALADVVSSGSPGTAFRFVAGSSRLALETRPEAYSSCIACGECMVGCPRRAMYSTVKDLEIWRRSGLISRVVSGRALAVNGQPPQIAVEAPDGHRDVLGPFDRIYVCAGCIGTTEFAMRSLGWRSGPRIVDNSVYTFPIAYKRSPPSRACDGRYVALTNLLVNAVPLDAESFPAQIQVYPVFDHLWRYFVPSALWAAAELLGHSLRRRMLLGRIFLHQRYSQIYAIEVDGDKHPRLSLAESGTPLSRIPDLWPDLCSNFGRKGFFVPFRPTRQLTSSHYAASMPLGKGPIGVDGSIARYKGVYLCDSSVFPTAPAASPTFTIMANARRIADLSLTK